MINEIIAQIGGRDNLVERIKQLQHDSDLGWTAEAYSLKVCKALLYVIDYQAKPPLPGVPDGWRLVPVQPTPAQWAAGQAGYFHGGINKVEPIYRAMIEAAPEYKV